MRAYPARRLEPRKTVNRGEGRKVPLMLDTKIILALALLLGSIKVIGDRPPAGGIPIPQRAPGVSVQ